MSKYQTNCCKNNLERTTAPRINRSREEVWQAITDIENSPAMITGIIKLNVLHQPDNGLIGLKWQETRKIFGKESSETMWITHCEAMHFYQTRAENHGTVYISRLTVTEQDNGTLLSMSFTDQ